MTWPPPHLRANQKEITIVSPIFKMSLDIIIIISHEV